VDYTAFTSRFTLFNISSSYVDCFRDSFMLRMTFRTCVVVFLHLSEWDYVIGLCCFKAERTLTELFLVCDAVNVLSCEYTNVVTRRKLLKLGNCLLHGASHVLHKSVLRSLMVLRSCL